MAWDFETPPELARRLEWADEFVREEVEPLDRLIDEPRLLLDPIRARLVPPLQDIVKKQGLWACHLSKEDGGSGGGYIEAALLNGILGRSQIAPVIFGCQSPDAGNSELLAKYATPDQRKRYLEPLVAGEVVSTFSVTEPQGGGDPTVYQTTAVLDGDEWVLNGEKWFSSGADRCAFLIVMAVTEPDADRHKRSSMFIVPSDAPGFEIIRDIRSVGKENREGHPYVRYTNVRVPAENLLGERGAAFRMMQTRMGVARLLMGMRAYGLLTQALAMMCERALSRRTQGELLADKQLVQEMIADSWFETEQLRLLVLQTAWRLERIGNSKEMRRDVSSVKALTARALKNVALRAVQLHGSIGTSPELPLMEMLVHGIEIGIADGPTEIHVTTVARDILARHQAAPGLFPTRHGPALDAAAKAKYAAELEAIASSLG